MSTETWWWLDAEHARERHRAQTDPATPWPIEPDQSDVIGWDTDEQDTDEQDTDE